MPKKIKLKRAKYMIPPKLDNNPVWDGVVTSLMPMLSFTNGAKGIGKRTYSVQISKVPTFNYKTLIEFDEVKEAVGNTTGLLVDIELEDKTLYYWRVSVSDEEGNHTDWEVSRFYVDTEYAIVPPELDRLVPNNVESSSPVDVAKAMDIMNPETYWHSDYGNDKEPWIIFDFGKKQEISKAYLMSDPNALEFTGWIIEYHWEKSNDGKKWTKIEKSDVKKNKSGRIETDFESLTTRFLKFVIKKWYGIAAKINDIRFYTPSTTKIENIPDNDYVLVIGTEQDGSCYTDLEAYIKKHYENIDVLSVPFYDITFDRINNLERLPTAVIISNNSVDYGKIPIHEYIGLLDFIRYCDIPLLGIGAGFHLQYMTYCTSYIRKIGYKVNNPIELANQRRKAKTFIRLKDSPLFTDVENKFTCVETNEWETVERISEIIEYENIADLDYPMAVKSKLKEMYGIQFIPDIKADFNKAENVLHNFIKLAFEQL